LELEKAAKHGAQHGVKIKKTWDSADGYDPSGSTRSVPRTNGKAVGAPTRSPMKLAAAPPWPDTSETQRETSSDDNYFDKHRGVEGFPA
jgi:hypothetical protein